jgi:addiction module HigA family antidote
MSDYLAKADRERCPPHPGEVIDDILPATGMSKTQIAALLGISRNQFHAIVAGKKPVSAYTAARLGKLFGNGPGLWLRLQASFDAWHAERDVDVSDVPTIKAA